MKVTIDCCDSDEFDGPDSLGVYLDNGKEVGRYCIACDPEAERASLEKMLKAVANEAVQAFSDMIELRD